MAGRDRRLFTLLPAVGLCSCVVPPSQAQTATPDPAPGMIEIAPTREPLTVTDALVRSGRAALRSRDYAAALQSLTLAAEREPERVEILWDQLDAALGLGDVPRAEALLSTVRGKATYGERNRVANREIELLELRNGRGVGRCEAAVAVEPTPLRRAPDAFAAWNELRTGLPADHAIPIPVDETEALEAICEYGCDIGEPNFPRLVGDNEATVALVIAHGDGSFSVLPDILHTNEASCNNEGVVAFDRHDGLLRVRAFAEHYDYTDPSDWNLVELPSYGPPPPTTTTTTPSTATYYGGSSGYQYAYGSSGYHYYGCGGYGYDYQYETCEVRSHVERDIVIDPDRDEVVLDVVRTGERGSALGRVRMTASPAGPVVEVEACGHSQALQLSYT